AGPEGALRAGVDLEPGPRRRGRQRHGSRGQGQGQGGDGDGCRRARGQGPARSVRRQLTAPTARSLSMRCVALMSLTVPDVERITSDWVVAPPPEKWTPRSRSPSVMPVAAKKQ